MPESTDVTEAADEATSVQQAPSLLEPRRRGAIGRAQLRLGLEQEGRRSIERGLLMILSNPLRKGEWVAEAYMARALEAWPPGAAPDRAHGRGDVR